MRRFLSSLACAAAVTAASPASAAAGELDIQVDAAVPFSAAELEAAFALRTTEAPPRIHVSPAPGTDAVVVSVGGAHRTVALSGLRGSAAARRVAVVSLDLLRGLPVPAREEPAATTDVEAPVEPAARVVDEPAFVGVSTRRRHPRAVLNLSGLYGLSGRGGSAHASIGVRGRLRGLISAGVEIEDGASDLRVTNIPIGVGLGWRWQWGKVALEAHGRLVVAPYRLAVDDGADRLEHSAVRFGSGALLSAGVHVAGPAYASVTGQLGAFVDRQRYLVGGTEVFANGRADASISLGISLAAGGMP